MTESAGSRPLPEDHDADRGLLIDDPSDERVAIFLGLRDHVARQRRERPGGDVAGSFIAEGDLVIQRALRAGCTLERVLVDASRAHRLPQLPATATVLRATPEVLHAISGRRKLRDPLACFTRTPLPTMHELLASSRDVERAARIAVLENVTNPNNTGMILRAAAGFGISGVVVDPSTCDPLYRRAIRASMGEVFAIPHARSNPLPEGLAEIHSAGFATVALTPDLDAPPIKMVAAELADQPVALLLGAEGPGLTAATLAAATHPARIAMSNDVDSLNVAVAAAVAFFAFGS